MPVNVAHQDAFPSLKQVKGVVIMLLRLCGGTNSALPCDSTYEPLADLFDLPTEARKLTCSQYYVGDPSESNAWANHLQWARRELRDSGDIANSQRGIWRLSEQGQKSADGEIQRQATLAAKIRALRVN